MSATERGDSSVPRWALGQVQMMQRHAARVGREWLSNVDCSEAWRTSRDQAGHILRVLVSYGVVERASIRSVGLDPADHRDSRFAFRPTLNGSSERRS